jgi:hypothetical protein
MRLFLILQFFALSAFAADTFDTFYIITGEQPVELHVTYQSQRVSLHHLVKGRTLELALYEKVCSSSNDSEYEVGIKNKTAISLKRSYPCYYYTPSNEKKGTLSEKFAITFRWFKKKLRLESNVRKQVIAEGRDDGDIDISKSQFPVLELNFDNDDDIKVVKLTVGYNDKIIKEIIVQGNSISMTDLKIGQIYIVQMIGKDGKNAVLQRFKIVK